MRQSVTLGACGANLRRAGGSPQPREHTHHTKEGAMFRYILIDDGMLAVKAQARPLTLAQMQAAVGGLIELFQTTGSVDFYCDEEGRLKDPLPNPNVFWGDHVIFGPVLVTGHNGNGELRSLTDRDIATVQGMLDYYGCFQEGRAHLPRLLAY
jgi:hypothetical protein